jgi:hypothetical protein
LAITTNSLRILGSVAPSFESLGRTVTIGRLGLYAPQWWLRDVLARRSRHASELISGSPEATWFDAYLRAGGTPSVDVIDASSYEGATIEHDLNRPMREDECESVDTLIDGGTLEHVFNVVGALETYLKLLRVGGRLFLFDMPLHGCCGHGFFQFSPVFFSESLSSRYGFRLDHMLATEDRPFSPFWDVASRLSKRERVEIQHSRPCHLQIVATKVAPFKGFDSFPLQPDYPARWEQQPSPSAMPARRFLQAVRVEAAKLWPRGYFTLSHDRDLRRHMAANQLNRLPRWSPQL